MILKSLNILIPAAGLGSRFSQAGYTFPKPLIEVNGKPMIQLVVDNLKEKLLGQYMELFFIFLFQKEHINKYDLEDMVKQIDTSSTIVAVDGITDGAARTTLLARDYIDSDDPLLISNSDQYIEWGVDVFPNTPFTSFENVDAGILTFNSVHPKWSYARLDDRGFVAEVAEKRPISDLATVGIYYWKRGSDYVKYADQMIKKNVRTNNEFYVCPVFNEAIADGKLVRVKNIKKMWGIGTPEDLQTYLEAHKQ